MSAEDSSHAGSSHDEAAGEPETPLWLTVLGVALFFAGFLAFLATRPAGKTTEELTRAAAPAPSASASAEPAAPAPAAPEPPSP
jgi:hypothetical protein